MLLNVSSVGEMLPKFKVDHGRNMHTVHFLKRIRNRLLSKSRLRVLDDRSNANETVATSRSHVRFGFYGARASKLIAK